MPPSPATMTRTASMNQKVRCRRRTCHSQGANNARVISSWHYYTLFVTVFSLWLPHVSSSSSSSLSRHQYSILGVYPMIESRGDKNGVVYSYSSHCRRTGYHTPRRSLKEWSSLTALSSSSSSTIPSYQSQFTVPTASTATFSSTGTSSTNFATTASSNSYNPSFKNGNNNPNSIVKDVQDQIKTLCRPITEKLRKQIPTDAWSVLAGAASFGGSLAISTTLQQKIFGISTGTPAPIPSLMGMASVCVASTTAHQVALATHVYATTGQWPTKFSLWPRHPRRRGGYYLFHENDQVWDLGVVQIPHHTLRIWAAGLVGYKLLGGRFWAVAPSSMTHLGSYARASLPATERYASARQRLQIERLGRIWGCHTCGSHRWTFWARSPPAQFVGDHMPPKSVAQQLERSLWYRVLRRKVRYRFYPQCIPCSNKQGSLLSQATAALQARSGASAARRLAAVGGGRGASYNHGWHIRLTHLTGALIGAIATVNVHPVDIMDENRWRYAQWQQDLVALWRKQESEILQRVQGMDTNANNGRNSRK